MTTSASSPWIALVGVTIGFVLGEGSRYVRYRLEIWRNFRLVETELQSVLAQIPQRRDILLQAIAHMKQERFMPLVAVRSVTAGYYAVQENLYPHMKAIDRNCLHIIFERLRVAEEQMDGMEESFMRAVKDKLPNNPWAVYIGRCEELLGSYELISNLARSYLEGKTIDVFVPMRDG